MNILIDDLRLGISLLAHYQLTVYGHAERAGLCSVLSLNCIYEHFSCNYES